MKRPAKILLGVGAGLTGLVLAAGVAGFFVLRSDWLREKVRLRIVSEVERATGGKAELGAFAFDWKTLRATAHNFVLHGTEPQGEAPLLRAGSVEVGLKILSALQRKVNVASLTVERPELRVIVAADGTTNFPSPKTPGSGKDPVETLLELAVGSFELRHGVAEYDNRRVPLDVRGENLNLSFAYQSAGPRYLGELSFDAVNLRLPSIEPLRVATRLSLALERNRVVISRADLDLKESRIGLSGVLSDFKHLHGEFDLQGRFSVPELVAKLHLPIERCGSTVLTGRFTFGGTEAYTFDGKLTGAGLAVGRGIDIPGIGLAAEVHMDPRRIDIPHVRATSLGGTFVGAGRIDGFRRFRFAGDARGFSLEEVARSRKVAEFAWSGLASGPAEISGQLVEPSDIVVAGKLKITPLPGPAPVEGLADLRYSERDARLELGHSWIRAPFSTLNVSGAIGGTLEVRLHSTNLNDFLPAIALGSSRAPKPLPITLVNGTLDFDGTVTGPLDNATVGGHAMATNFRMEGQALDRLDAQFQVNQGGLELQHFALVRGRTTLEGKGRLGFVDWEPVASSPLAISGVVEKADLAELLADNGQKDVPVSGLASLKVQASGTWGEPAASGSLRVLEPQVYGQKFDRFQADLSLKAKNFQVTNARAELGPAVLEAQGSYDHSGAGWSNGFARFSVKSRGATLGRLRSVHDWRPDVDGAATLEAAGSARVVNSKPALAQLNGALEILDLSLNRHRTGSLKVTAATAGEQLNVRIRLGLDGSSPIDGQATVRLAGDYPGSGQVSVPRLDFVTLNTLRRAAGADDNLPFIGFLEGGASFSGPLARLDALRGQVQLTRVQVSPLEKAAFGSAELWRDLSLVNSGPVEVAFDGKGLQIRHAEFTARDTKVSAAGSIAFNSRNAWDLRLEGTLNLAIFRSFATHLRTEGGSEFQIAMRGSLDNPQITGQMQLKNATLNYADLPNGISNANGQIVFDRNRATISSLTGASGGGQVSLSGFVGFGTGTVLYRLAAQATNVRVRYPEGASTTVTASLNLSGNSSQSLLSGMVTIERVGFRPKTDVGGLLAAAQPVSTPAAPNEALRNIQLDIRIQTSANAEFSTTYTQDVRAEADLRLRGSAARPSLQGRVNVLQGDVLFFGNRYTINRGDVAFYNPTRIEPVLDLNLQTAVRGISVTINFSGTLERLNMNYRSDPPLQTQEIVALLAVGRAPTTGSGLASGQQVASGDLLNSGANALLGQAVATPVSSRLQRFFGVSRLKIDPLLQGTSVDTTPQARLTLEQQISPNVTLTYVTNVTKSQQQLVRLQWDINRQWSVVAVRDENGVFGVDFLYRRRF